MEFVSFSVEVLNFFLLRTRHTRVESFKCQRSAQYFGFLRFFKETLLKIFLIIPETLVWTECEMSVRFVLKSSIRQGNLSRIHLIDLNVCFCLFFNLAKEEYQKRDSY